MTDPMDALFGLQTALDRGLVRISPCDVHPELGFLFDEPNGVPRFTYALLRLKKVQAVALFVRAEPVRGTPCFTIGYAVVEAARNKGLGSTVLELSIDELKHGLGRAQISEF